MDDEIDRELIQFVRMMWTSGNHMTETIARGRQQRAQQRLAEIDRAERNAAADGRAREQEWADVRRREYQKVGWDDWRESATLGQWSTAYGAAREARDRGNDPQAAQACNQIRREVADRFDLDLAREYERMKQGAAQEDTHDKGVHVHDDAAEKHGAAAEHEEADQAPPLPGGEEVIEPEVLTAEEAQSRFRQNYIGTTPEWLKDADRDDILSRYQHARIAEGADPLARTATRNVEAYMARTQPDRYSSPEGFRQSYDRAVDNVDRGARPGQPGPQGERDEQRAQEQDRDFHRDGRRQGGAQRESAEDAVADMQQQRPPAPGAEAAELTTSKTATTAQERATAERSTRMVGVGYASLESRPKNAKALPSGGKPKARAIEQGRDRNVNKGGRRR